MKTKKQFFVIMLALFIGGMFLTMPALAESALADDDGIIMTETNGDATVICHGRTYVDNVSTNGVKVTLWLTYYCQVDNKLTWCDVPGVTYSYQSGNVRGYYKHVFKLNNYRGALTKLYLKGEKGQDNAERWIYQPYVYMENYRHLFLN